MTFSSKKQKTLSKKFGFNIKEIRDFGLKVDQTRFGSPKKFRYCPFFDQHAFSINCYSLKMLILACQEVYNINLTLNDDSGTLNRSFFNYVDHIMTTFLIMVDSCEGIPLLL